MISVLIFSGQSVQAHWPDFFGVLPAMAVSVASMTKKANSTFIQIVHPVCCGIDVHKKKNFGVSHFWRRLFDRCRMMDDFKARYAPIQEFLFSGVGIDLQNADSRIMETIMMKLQADGIPALPIHDSAIVQEEHSARLQKIMFQVYEEEMGHAPVLKAS